MARVRWLAMCGIFGYVGQEKSDAFPICLEGLKNLEYRGYDSAGLAGIDRGKIVVCKRPGKLKQLEKALIPNILRLNMAIAHTRWATHGKPTQLNAHPHVDAQKKIAIVHNGIIENHVALREKLKTYGYQFESDTDSEVIAHLIAYHECDDLRKTFQKTLNEIQGSLAIAMIHADHPNQIFATSRSSPLVLGLSKEGDAAFLASDANAFVEKNLITYYLQDHDVAIIQKDRINFFDQTGKSLDKKGELLTRELLKISKGEYSHFMSKEIHEQPQTIQKTLENRIDEEKGTGYFEELEPFKERLSGIDQIIIIGCGTSWHAGLVSSKMIEEIARIPTRCEIASEFRYSHPIITSKTLVVAISQSGETADTLAAMKEAKQGGAFLLGVCNVPRSTLTRLSDATLFLKAGQEISVCSTKAFTAQLTLLSLLALYFARMGSYTPEQGKAFLKELKRLPHQVSQVLMLSDQIEGIAKKYASFEHLFFLGRQYMYPTAMEGALKLKEISYLVATAIAAGEMKHGSIALISPDVGVIALAGHQPTRDKLFSNLMEVKARGAEVLTFTSEEHLPPNMSDDLIVLPLISDLLAPILYSTALQLFAYHIANYLGKEIDQPRNLAKSVTVE